MFLKDPNVMVEHLKNNPYTEKIKEELQFNVDRYKRLIADMEQGLVNINDMYAHNKITKSEYEIRSAQTQTEIKQHQEKYLQLVQQLDKQIDVNKYAESFKYIYKHYKDNINIMLEDVDQRRRLFDIFIKDIIIYSRPKKENEVLAGKKVEDQQIPYKIELYFNLPQDSIEYLWNSVHPTRAIENYHEQNLNTKGKFMFLEKKKDPLNLRKKSKERADIDIKQFNPALEKIDKKDMKLLVKNNKDYEKWILDPKGEKFEYNLG